MTRYAGVSLRVTALVVGVVASPPLRSEVGDLIFADGFDPAAIVINEIESNPSPDWVELYNRSTAAVDISGWSVTDSDPTHAEFLPAGTLLAAGSFYVFTPAAFGLGQPDSAVLYDNFGRLVDSYSWSVHAVGTYARCPDGFGAFLDVATATQGSSNVVACPP